MKKAKIFLTALTVMAVVAGALAFKTKGLWVYYTDDGVSPICTVPVTTTFETTLGGDTFRPYDTFGAPTPCETLITFAD